MRPIPFELPDTGLREITGKLYVEEPYLVFEVTDGLLGAFDKENQVIKIEIDALDEIHFKKGIVKDKLYIRSKKRDLLDAMPGKYDGVLMLKIWKTHRPAAEEIRGLLQAHLSGKL
jgi:hypothetical protein